MPTADIRGVGLEYVERGSGEPLVLVHGSASDHRTWHAQLAPFGDRFRTIAYSRRHHWPNAAIAAGADYSMTEHVDDLEALLRRLGGVPAHLVGHSYGALVALMLALRAPGCVRSLVLEEPPAVGLFLSARPAPGEIVRMLSRWPRTGVAVLRLAATGLVPATAAARQGDMESAMRLFGSAALGREAYDRLSPARREQARANMIAAEFVGSGLPRLDAAALRGLAVPTLLVTGAKSPPVFRRLADRLAELLPDVERVEIADSSHLVHEDAAPAFGAAVIGFLERADRPNRPGRRIWTTAPSRSI